MDAIADRGLEKTCNKAKFTRIPNKTYGRMFAHAMVDVFGLRSNFSLGFSAIRS